MLSTKPVIATGSSSLLLWAIENCEDLTNLELTIVYRALAYCKLYQKFF